RRGHARRRRTVRMEGLAPWEVMTLLLALVAGGGLAIAHGWLTRATDALTGLGRTLDDAERGLVLDDGPARRPGRRPTRLDQHRPARPAPDQPRARPGGKPETASTRTT